MNKIVASRTAEIDLDPVRIRAEFDRAAALATASPASQAGCDIMSLVRGRSPALKSMPLTTRFRGAGPTNDGWDRWWASWGCNGQSFSLYLSMYGPFTSAKADGTPGVRIHGDGFLSLDVDDETVMSLRVELRCDDPEARIRVVGATEFEPGPWAEVIAELDRRLAETARQSARKAG
jgi:hypothetical protein